MPFSFRKFSKHIFIIINVLVALAFCAACLQPYAEAHTFWFLGFFSLSFPYLFIILLVFIFFWLAANVRYTLISILAMAIAWKQIDVLFNIKPTEFSNNKANGTLRVMSWNVKSFRGMDNNRKVQDRNAEKIFKLIDDAKPDLLFLQEFAQYDSVSEKRNYIKLLQQLGYQHYLLSKDYVREKVGYSSGVAIFSKYPLLNPEKVSFTGSPESLLYADFVMKNDTIRVFTAHFQSFKFSGNDYRDIQKIKNTEDSLYEASMNIYSKMKRAFRQRAGQADEMKSLLNKSPYPVLLGCDMNDVPTSYSYWALKGDRKDAFVEKGFGIGRTFIAIAPTLRIDYIITDTSFTVNQFNILQKRYSDHMPIVTDLKLTRTQEKRQ